VALQAVVPKVVADPVVLASVAVLEVDEVPGLTVVAENAHSVPLDRMRSNQPSN
jgi:hypothetical protein